MVDVDVTAVQTTVKKCLIVILCLSLLGSGLGPAGTYGRILNQSPPGIEVRTGSTSPENQRGEVIKNSFRPLPFPVNFRYYDRNRDGYVNVQELKKVTGDAENVDLAFRASDLNGDSWVSEAEYRQVPWGYDRQRDYVLPDGK